MRQRKLVLDLAWIAPVLAAFGLLLAAPAGAQDEDEEEEDYYSRPGVYLLAQFTNNIGTFSSPDAVIDTNSGEYSTGAAGAFGYRINEHLAAELAGDWVSGWKVHVDGSQKDMIGGTYGVNVKGYLKGGHFQPYGLLGLGATFMQVRNSPLTPLSDAQWDMGIRIALGADWYVTHDLGLNIAPTVVVPVGINSNVSPDLTYVSIAIGGFVRFGGD